METLPAGAKYTLYTIIGSDWKGVNFYSSIEEAEEDWKYELDILPTLPYGRARDSSAREKLTAVLTEVMSSSCVKQKSKAVIKEVLWRFVIP